MKRYQKKKNEKLKCNEKNEKSMKAEVQHLMIIRCAKKNSEEHFCYILLCFCIQQ